MGCLVGCYCTRGQFLPDVVSSVLKLAAGRSVLIGPVSSHTDSGNITWVLGVLSTQYSRCSENVFVLIRYLWSSYSTVFYMKQRNKANNKTKVVVGRVVGVVVLATLYSTNVAVIPPFPNPVCPTLQL